MRSLDDQKFLASIDRARVYDSVASFGDQLTQAWQDTSLLSLSDSYRNVKNIVLCGMGGSALGAHIIQTLYEEKWSVPFSIQNGYTLPNTVNDDTLVILSSYSGNTEETLACAEQALRRQAKIIGVTAGGHLATFLQNHNYPAYVFDPKHNPSGQPRMGSGYTLGFLLCIFQKLGFLPVEEKEIKDASVFVKELERHYGKDIAKKSNPAKQLAQTFKNKQIVMVASEFLRGNAHMFCNQINENAKQFSCFFEIPELNHHLLEGMRFPKTNKKNLTFLLLVSHLYNERVRVRYNITETVLQKNNIASAVWQPTGKGKLAQAMETLAFGSYFSYYLAMINDVDPSEIPFVEYFKEALEKAAPADKG